MRELFNIIKAILSAIASLGLAVVLSLFAYKKFPNWIGMLLVFVIVVLGIWLGVTLAKRAAKKGGVDFMTSNDGAQKGKE